MKKIFDNQKGFTLLELLTVVSIIIILAGVIMPAINVARTRAFKSKTRARMASLELALSMYEADMGNYPKESSPMPAPEPLSEIWFVGGSGVVSNWNGPYMEFKQNEVIAGNVVDAWGTAFYYQCPGTHNTQSFDLFSCGKDLTPGTSDDIVNW